MNHTERKRVDRITPATNIQPIPGRMSSQKILVVILARSCNVASGVISVEWFKVKGGSSIASEVERIYILVCFGACFEVAAGITR